MVPNYFKEGSKEYFEERKESKKDEKKSIADFKISTKKYNQRDMKIEIVEYEIKD